MPPIAVGERVDGNQAVMEANPIRVLWLRPALDPRTRVAHEIANRARNLRRFNADIRLSSSICSRLGPNVTEHGSV